MNPTLFFFLLYLHCATFYDFFSSHFRFFHHWHMFSFCAQQSQLEPFCRSFFHFFCAPRQHSLSPENKLLESWIHPPPLPFHSFNLSLSQSGAAAFVQAAACHTACHPLRHQLAGGGGAGHGLPHGQRWVRVPWEEWTPAFCIQHRI